MHQVGQRRCAEGCLPWPMAMLQCGSLACVREVAKILWGRPWKEGLGVSGLPAASRDNPAQNEIDGGEPDENPVNPEHVSVHGCHPSKNPTHPQARPAGNCPVKCVLSPLGSILCNLAITREKIRHPLVLGGALGRRLKPSGEAALLSPEGPANRQSMLPNLHAPPVAARRIAGLRACRTVSYATCERRNKDGVIR